MLRNTFCHIPTISLQRERLLWQEGIETWDHVLARNASVSEHAAVIRDAVAASVCAVDNGDIGHFADALPGGEDWRLFGEFRDRAVYLDIETTGMGQETDHITTIVAYDGVEARHFVYGANLDQFPRFARDIVLAVTYNGKCFDIPFIRRHFGIDLDPVHLDLRYILRSIGITGGLKKCERQLGLDRKDLVDVDGYMAVLLWREYQRRKNIKALETLLAYNFLDAVNLERLMIEAFNRKLEGTPFAERNVLPLPRWQPSNPFPVDVDLLDRLRGASPWVR